MIMSRVLPSLIKLNKVIALNSLAKKPLLCSASVAQIKLIPEIGRKFHFRTMSTDVDKELNDPKRHFDYNQLVERMKQSGVVVIDVREHSEINETGKIPGSIHIPLNNVQSALNLSNEELLNLYSLEKPKLSDEIIFTCRSGRRSLIAMKTAFELGYTKAGNYKGGWLDWAEKSAQSK